MPCTYPTPQAPTVTLTANPSSIQSGQNSTLTWNSQNATSCSAYWTNSSATSGSGVVVLGSTTTYSITCYGTNGTSATAQATVNVNQVQNNPTVTLTANPTTIQSGQNSTLTWYSQNATSCSGYWMNSSATSGSGVVVPTATTTYTITCYGSNGQQATAQATVYLNQNQTNPTVYLTASPTSIQSGQSSSLNWSSQNANYCSSSWNGGSSSTSGYQTVYPTYTTNYTVTCYGTNGQSAVASATVYVNSTIQTCQDTRANNYGGILPCIYTQINNQPTVVVFSDQTSVAYNGSATVRWITTNATSCYASGGSLGWPGTKSIGPGSFYTGSLTGSRTYTLTCTNSHGTATDSETIVVRGQNINPGPTPTRTSLVLITSSVDRNQPIVPTLDNTRPRPGDEINYTVSYQNIGTGSITGLTLRIDLPYEVDYMFSNPNNPTRNGNTLIFNLGTLKANGQGTVTVRVRVRENIPAGTNLNFPATLSYIDPSGYPQSVTANVSAQIYSAPDENINLGANVFWAGFLPANLFGWLLLLILILILIYLAKYLFGQQKQAYVLPAPASPITLPKRTTTTTVIEH